MVATPPLTAQWFQSRDFAKESLVSSDASDFFFVVSPLLLAILLTWLSKKVFDEDFQIAFFDLPAPPDFGALESSFANGGP